MVTYEEFKKMEIRVGTVKHVELVPETDKLLKCTIDFGLISSAPADEGATGTIEPVPDVRTIVSGIREYYPDYEKLIGKQLLYITNLEPRMIKGIESRGMLLAVDGKDGNPVFVIPETEVHPGSAIR